MRILIVDDELPWRLALSDMYSKAMGSGSHTFDLAATVSEAKLALKRNRYDILSLDINLVRNAATDSHGRPMSACGKEVLDYAYTHNSADAVIVISGCAWDDELSMVIDDRGKEIEIRANMEGILKKMYKTRCRFIPKPDPKQVSIENTIAAWQPSITKGSLASLTRGGILSPPYCLEVTIRGGMADSISVISKSSKDQREVGREDVDFLWSLIMQWQDDAKGLRAKDAAIALLGREEAERRLEKYGPHGEYAHLNRSEQERHAMMQRTVDGYITSFKRRLQNLDINPEGIIEKWSPSGWRLARSVEIKGRSDLKKRSSGHGGTGSFNPIQEVASDGKTADSIASDNEMQEISSRFLKLADTEETNTFMSLSTEAQETILEIFARHTNSLCEDCRQRLR